MQVETLDRYEQLLLERAVPRGMVAFADSDHLHDRHVLDSLRAVPYIDRDIGPVVDLGSGAGLPGVPVAVARPDLSLTLVEPRQARAAFLELVVEQLVLPNVRVFAGPAQGLSPHYAAALARGLGDVSRSWSIAASVLVPEGMLIYWAGRTFRPSDVPAGALLRTADEPALESRGPIVIMTRQ
ncbi:MAG: 16S rRNA (guanine(527)-N(7))-methyltransferase RsmG [Actinomycetota bacterium]